MLQQETPEDYVIATGEQYSVREFVAAVAAELGMDMRWEGSGVEEKGYDADGNCIVQVDRALLPTSRGRARCSATRPRRANSSAGSRPPRSATWSARW